MFNWLSHKNRRNNNVFSIPIQVAVSEQWTTTSTIWPPGTHFKPQVGNGENLLAFERVVYGKFSVGATENNCPHFPPLAVQPSSCSFIMILFHRVASWQRETLQSRNKFNINHPGVGGYKLEEIIYSLDFFQVCPVTFPSRSRRWSLNPYEKFRTSAAKTGNFVCRLIVYGL